MSDLRFAMIGAGFWARYQLAGWRECGGARCVALCDPTPGRAAALAGEFAVPAVHTDAAAMLAAERLDFVDIVSSVDTHVPLARLAARHRLPTICQKPLAPDAPTAAALAAEFASAGVPLLVHENWRWQRPIRRVAALLAEGRVGRVFRATIDLVSGFDVFANQPSLAELDRFILADLGTHLLDTARFLFGEPQTLYCRTARVHTAIRGEDVATVVLGFADGTVLVRMAYAGNPVDPECFPQTLMTVEADRGMIRLLPDYRIAITTAAGTETLHEPPPLYDWVQPRYAVVQSSIVDCTRNLLPGLTGGPTETTAADNVRTLALVDAAYTSAKAGAAVAV